MVTYFWADNDGWWWQCEGGQPHGPYDGYEQAIYRWRHPKPKLKVV